MTSCASPIDDAQKSTGASPHRSSSLDSSDHLIYGNSAYILQCAWLFLMFTPAVFGLTPSLDVNEEFILRIGFLVAITISYLVEGAFSERLYSESGMKGIAVVALVLSPLATLGALLKAPFTVLLVLWCLSGVGQSCMTLLAYKFSSSLSHGSLILSTTVSFALAALLACLVVFLTPIEFRLVVITVMPVACVGLNMLNDALHPRAVRSVSLVETRKRSHVSWKASGAVICHTMCLGFAVYIIGFLATEGHYWIIILVTLGIFVMSVASAADGFAGSGWLLDEGAQLRYTLVTAMVCMAPIFVFESYGMLVSGWLLVVFFIVHEMTNRNAVAENIKLDKLNLVYVCACSRPVNSSGLAIGYACGFAAYMLGGGLETSGDWSIPIAFLMLLFISILSAALFLNRYPGVAEDAHMDLPVNQEQAGAARHSSWKERCEAFGNSVGLSPRQRDVFMLLTKGHNASYIERKLVISNHTVKSHTYSIYQKAGVHSRQELIEKVESFDSDEKKY